MRALLTDADRFPFDDEDRAGLAGAGVELIELAGHEPQEIAQAGRGVHAVFVYSAAMTADVIACLVECRVLARCGTGYDNIDMDAARARGIEVVYVPDYGADDVSDHALALLLACSRKIAVSDRLIRMGHWPGYVELGAMHRLRGRTLGLLGFGRIARRLAEKAAALGCEVVGHDPYVQADRFLDSGVRAVERQALFQASDVLSIHVPLAETTYHAVGRAELELMRPHAIIINTSRGPIIDHVALGAALCEQRIGGAGLDVFEEEPLPPGDPLMAHEGVVLTPHSAAFSEEGLAEVRKCALADALRVLAGDPPHNPVPSKGSR